MFFSKVVLFAISLGALSVLATPHALHHHALHRRAVAARVASTQIHSNSSDVAAKRQNSPKCSHRSAPPSSSSSSTVPKVTDIVQNLPLPLTTPTLSPTSTPHQHQQPPSTTSSATPPPTTKSPGTGGGDDGPFSGDGTFFETGLGACGITNTDADFIVAVSQIRYDAASNGPDPNTNPLCGRKVSISFGGHSATATVVDRCTGCARDDLDMTPDLFKIFSDPGAGRIHPIVWGFIS